MSVKALRAAGARRRRCSQVISKKVTEDEDDVESLRSDSTARARWRSPLGLRPGCLPPGLRRWLRGARWWSSR